MQQNNSNNNNTNNSKKPIYTDKLTSNPKIQEDLDKLSADIELMLGEQESLLELDLPETKEEEKEEGVAKDQSEELSEELPEEISETLRKRQQQQTNKLNKNQKLVEIIDSARLEGLANQVRTIEEETLEELLEVLTLAVGFAGGMQKFIDVCANQLKLADIDIKQEKYENILEQLFDNKVLSLLTKKLLQKEPENEALFGLEFSIYEKLINNYFGFDVGNTKEATKKQNTLNNSSNDSIQQQQLNRTLKDLSTTINSIQPLLRQRTDLSNNYNKLGSNITMNVGRTLDEYIAKIDKRFKKLEESASPGSKIKPTVKPRGFRK